MVENLDGCSIGTTFVPSVLNNNLVRGWDLNGFYLIDDLNYQAHWSGFHQEKGLYLVEKLKYHPDFFTFPIDVSTGLLLLCKK